MASNNLDTDKRAPKSAETILLGTAPALSSEHGKNGPPDIKDVSLRWLAGTVLTGLTSITLMGGALLVAVDGQTKFAKPARIIAEASAALPARQGQNNIALNTKGDRPITLPDDSKKNNVLHLSTLTRGSDGDRVRSRPFARLSMPLGRHSNDPEFDIPEFDPVTIFSGATKFIEKGEEEILYDAQLDDEIAIKTLPLAVGKYDNQAVRGFSDDEIEAKVRLQVPLLNASLEDGTLFARAGAIAYVDPARFEGKSESSLIRPSESTFDSFVKIRSENVLTIEKTNNIARLQFSGHEKTVSLPAERPLALFWREDMKLQAEAAPLIEAISSELGTDTLTSEHKIRLRYAGGPNPESPDIVSIYKTDAHLLTLARSDDGHFVPVQDLDATTIEDQEIEAAPQVTESVSVYRGIMETALKNNLPMPLARELIRIFAFDVDFRSSTRQSDEMEIFLSLDPDEEKATEESEILYTALTLGEVKRRYYRFKTTDDGEVDYYDEDGRSAKKFLMRQPVPRAKFRSGYGWRRHPILRTTRLHNGVDWSAPRGTPIFAAGNGVVEEAKWFSGYGRRAIVRHANGYKTAYAHMSRFAKGIEPGVAVRQGQIIGYVGSTGLSTGPHLHYEVIVNGNHVDPMRIRLPRGRVLSGEQLAAFDAERNRIDQLLKTSDGATAQGLALNGLNQGITGAIGQ